MPEARLDECLLCFLGRALPLVDQCDGTGRLTKAWSAAQRSGRCVSRWLEGRGGFCDCEVIMNALHGPMTVRGLRLVCAEAAAALAQEDDPDDE